MYLAGGGRDAILDLGKGRRHNRSVSRVWKVFTSWWSPVRALGGLSGLGSR